MGINIVEEELGRKSVFMNEEKLSTDYVPSHLIHRDAELRQLAQFFRVLIQAPGTCSKTVSILGAVGTGKTAIAKRFGAFLEESASLRNINLKYIHINCRKQKTSTLILTTIIRNFSPNIPLRGFSTAELLYLLNEVLEKNNVFLLLVLDEADYLLRKNNSADFIYDLIRLNDDKLNAIQRISLIVIGKTINYYALFDISTLSTFQKNVIRLNKYAINQLKDILWARIEEAFYEGVVLPETVDLIADIASQWGDARLALDLLWRAGKYADKNFELKVAPEHTRKAKGDIYPVIRQETVEALSKQQLLILLSIARALKKENKAYITMGDLEETYTVICEEYEEKPRVHTQLWEYIKELEMEGIIATKISSKGYRGKTTLITIADAPTKIVEKKIETILDKYPKKQSKKT